MMRQVADTTTGLSDIAPADQAVSTLTDMANGFFETLPKLGIALVILVGFWLVGKAIRSVIHRVTPGPKDSSIGIVLGRLAYTGVLLLGVFIAIAVIFPAVTAGTLISGLGIGGIAIGFAFQDIFQNLLAGILLLLREPFRIGDEITSGEYTGTVESVETRATFIRTYDGRRVIIPNSKIYTEPVTVITAYDMVRSEYVVGIGYGDDTERAKALIMETLNGIEGVLQDPAPDVLTWTLGESSVNLRVRWWSHADRAKVVELRDEVLRKLNQTLAGAGVDLPFPTQVILFHDQTEETDGDRTRQREGWPAGDNPPKPRVRIDPTSTASPE